MTGDVEEIEGSGQRGVTDKEMDDEDGQASKTTIMYVCFTIKLAHNACV